MFTSSSRLALAVALAGASTLVFADDTINLGSVVVSASGFEQNIAEAPATITSVSGEELSKRSYTDISDAVKNIPGIFMTGGGESRDISIRGMDASYTLYLIDGRPVSAGRNVNTNGTDGGKQIGLPPASMIERIEVIRGPMSSLYGSEAMGGVINIITKKATDKWHGSISTEYTHSLSSLNEDERQTEVQLSGGLVPGKLGLQLHGSVHKTDESELVTNDVKSGESTPDSTRKQGGMKLVYTPDEANELELGYTASKKDYSHTSGVSIPDTLDSTSNSFTKDVIMLGHRGTYNTFTLDSYLQHDVSERVQDLTKKEQMTTFNTQGSRLFGNHMVTLGGQYKYEDLTDETNGLLEISPDASANVTRWLAALYAETEWAVLDNMSVTTGLRFNDDEYFGSHWTPRLYGNFFMTPELTFKAGVSTGYKQPSLPSATEGFARGTGGGGSPAPHPRALIVGNPNLKPETSTSYELGFVYEDLARNLDASAMVFHTEFEDKIQEYRFCDAGGDRDDPSTWGCPFQGNNYLFLSRGMNVEKAEMQGLELAFSYALFPELHMNTSYTYTRSKQKSGEFKGEPLNRQPKEMVNIGFDWQAGDATNVWVDTNVRGRTSDYLSRTAMAGGTPSYNFVDVGVNYQLAPQAKIKAGLYNVGNKKVTTEDGYGVVLDGRRVNVGLTVDF